MVLFSLLHVKEIPSQLQIHPEPRRGAEEFGESQCRARRHDPPSAHDLVDALIRHADHRRQTSLRKTQGSQKLLQEHFPGMRRYSVGRDKHYEAILLVVVHDFDLKRAGR